MYNKVTFMATQNSAKKPPKGSIRFSLSLSPEQKSAKQAILHHPYNFIVGKAGSGKTLLACQVALDMFFKRQIDKIIITRPTVSTEDNGFLAGSEKEKMEKEEKIELVSLAHFRGRTFENSIIIVDEFQNLTRSQFRMALGRLGKNSTMIICGDNQQIDLKDKNYSAIVDLPKIDNSQYVYKRVLQDTHRHIAIDEVFELLNGM